MPLANGRVDPEVAHVGAESVQRAADFGALDLRSGAVAVADGAVGVTDGVVGSESAEAYGEKALVRRFFEAVRRRFNHACDAFGAVNVPSAWVSVGLGAMAVAHARLRPANGDTALQMRRLVSRMGRSAGKLGKSA